MSGSAGTWNLREVRKRRSDSLGCKKSHPGLANIGVPSTGSILYGGKGHGRGSAAPERGEFKYLITLMRSTYVDSMSGCLTGDGSEPQVFDRKSLEDMSFQRNFAVGINRVLTM